MSDSTNPYAYTELTAGKNTPLLTDEQSIRLGKELIRLSIKRHFEQDFGKTEEIYTKRNGDSSLLIKILMAKEQDLKFLNQLYSISNTQHLKCDDRFGHLSFSLSGYNPFADLLRPEERSPQDAGALRAMESSMEQHFQVIERVLEKTDPSFSMKFESKDPFGFAQRINKMRQSVAAYVHAAEDESAVNEQMVAQFETIGSELKTITKHSPEYAEWLFPNPEDGRALQEAIDQLNVVHSASEHVLDRVAHRAHYSLVQRLAQAQGLVDERSHCTDSAALGAMTKIQPGQFADRTDPPPRP